MELETCPRRMFETGPWEKIEGMDSWSKERWAKDGDHWDWHWTPRVCSFCGGANPQDVIQLIDEGWEIATTTKPYKRYLQPPGFKLFIEERTLYPDRRDLRYFVPVPPVKVYVWHFTEREVEVFNERLMTERTMH